MYVQDIEHMLFNWYEIKNFWFDVAHLWNSKFNYIDKFVPDVFVITFAILNNVTASRDHNCLIQYGKEFICVAKKKNRNIHLYKTFKNKYWKNARLDKMIVYIEISKCLEKHKYLYSYSFLLFFLPVLHIFVQLCLYIVIYY